MSWNTPERRVVFAGPPGWSRLPNVTRALLVLTAAGYLAGLLAPSRMRLLAVFPELVWPALELWRLVTYPLAVIGIFNVLFGLLILWTFGWELESVFGSRRFGLFVLSSVVASAVLGCGVALLFPRAGAMAGAGLSGLLTAMIVVWALLGPEPSREPLRNPPDDAEGLRAPRPRPRRLRRAGVVPLARPARLPPRRPSRRVVLREGLPARRWRKRPPVPPTLESVSATPIHRGRRSKRPGSLSLVRSSRALPTHPSPIFRTSPRRRRAPPRVVGGGRGVGP